MYMANVVIPADVSRDSYIKYCMTNSLVCLMGEFGSFKKDVIVPKHCIKDIVFPKEGETFGSPVIYTKIGLSSNDHVVVSVLNFRNNVQSVQYSEFELGGDNAKIVGSKEDGSIGIQSDNTIDINSKKIKSVSDSLSVDTKSAKINSKTLSIKSENISTVGKDLDMEVDDIKIKLANIISVNDGKKEVVVDALISFLESFLQSYDTHTHIVAGIPSTPPTIPQSPSFLSQKQQFTSKLIKI
jgi:hypothetical protein